MTNDEIEILEDILCLYRTICQEIEAECKLDRTMICDTLARLKTGEYEIRNNPNY